MLSIFIGDACACLRNARELWLTATIWLIRHAAHSEVGERLSGRTPGIPLSAAGERQADMLARRLGRQAFAAIQASPVVRAERTATAIAGDRPVTVVPALEEIDFGAWAGRSFAELETDPGWRSWNASRGGARAPGGEAMAEAQARAVAHVDAAAGEHPGGDVAMVSHADVIRAVIAHYIGLSLDNILRFDIDPASVSRLAVGGWGGRLLALNEGVA